MAVGRTNRRAFIAGLGSAAVWSGVARGQQARGRIGVPINPEEIRLVGTVRVSWRVVPSICRAQ
jgi:hypothetical protein